MEDRSMKFAENGGRGATALPVRKRLDHRGPLSIDVTRAWYFITICAEGHCPWVMTKENGRAVAPRPPQSELSAIAPLILREARENHVRGIWRLALFLVMPDHLHFIIHAGGGEDGGRGATALPRVIARFKHLLAGRYGLRFQRGFWDTRLRNEAHYNDKFRYICNNPVRKGICALARDWPYSIAFEQETGLERRHRGTIPRQDLSEPMMPFVGDELPLHSLILDYLEKFGSASREQINELLIDEIRGDYSKEGKFDKISNILSYLRINRKIRNVGTKHDSIWVLCTSEGNPDRIQEKTQIGF